MVDEVAAISDREKQLRVMSIVPTRDANIELTNAVFDRAAELIRLGFASADATHLAAAETEADVFLSCDDELLRKAKRHHARLRIEVANPLAWLKEHE